MSIMVVNSILYFTRSADGTILMSWEFVGDYIDITKFTTLILLSFVLAFCVSENNLNINKRQYPILLFLFAFFIGALFWNVPEINPDVCRYFSQAKYLSEHGIISFFREWGDSILRGTDFPVIPSLYGLIFRYFGEYRENIQIFSTLLFATTCMLTYIIGKRLWNTNTGLYAGFLLSTFPYFLSQVPLMLVDIPTVFFITLLVLAYYIALGPKKSYFWIVIASFCIFFAFYSKVHTIFVIVGVIPTTTLISYLKSEMKKTIIIRSMMIIAFSTVLIFFIFMLKYNVLISQMNLLISHQRSGWTNPVSPLSLFYQIGGITILLSIFSIIIFKKHKGWEYLILLAWILVPFIFLQNTRLRYLMVIFPAIALTAGISISAINDQRVRKFLVSSIIMSSLLLSLLAYLPLMQSYSDINLKNAAGFTNSRPDINKIAIFTVYSQETDSPILQSKTLAPIYDYYSNDEIIYYNYKTFTNFENYPDAVVIISDQPLLEYFNYNQALSTNNYQLTKIFSGGDQGIWRPCIVKVYLPLIIADAGKSWTINHDRRAVLGQHPPASGKSYISYNLTVPKNAHLQFGIGLDPKVWSPNKGDGVLFEIYLNPSDTEETFQLFSKYIDPKNNVSDRKWHDFKIDLSEWEGKEVTLSFVTECGKNSVYDWSGWGNPRIIIE